MCVRTYHDPRRYLSHLPTNCEFVICELDLRSVLSEATLAAFAPTIEARRAGRKKRAAREKAQAKQQARQIRLRQQQQDEHHAALLRQDREGVEPSSVMSEPALWDAGAFPAAAVASYGHSVGVALDSDTDAAVASSPSSVATHLSFSRAVGGILSRDEVSNPTLGRSFDEEHPPLAAAKVAPRRHPATSAAVGASASVTGTAIGWGLKKSVSTKPPLTASPARDSAPAGVGSASPRAEHEPPPPSESFFAGVEGALETLASTPPSSSGVSRAGRKGKKVLLLSTSSIRHHD